MKEYRKYIKNTAFNQSPEQSRKSICPWQKPGFSSRDSTSILFCKLSENNASTSNEIANGNYGLSQALAADSVLMEEPRSAASC